MKRIATRLPISFVKKIRAAFMIRSVGVTNITFLRRPFQEFGLKSYKPAKNRN